MEFGLVWGEDFDEDARTEFVFVVEGFDAIGDFDRGLERTPAGEHDAEGGVGAEVEPNGGVEEAVLQDGLEIFPGFREGFLGADFCHDLQSEAAGHGVFLLVEEVAVGADEGIHVGLGVGEGLQDELLGLGGVFPGFDGGMEELFDFLRGVVPGVAIAVSIVQQSIHQSFEVISWVFRRGASTCAPGKCWVLLRSTQPTKH